MHNINIFFLFQFENEFKELWSRNDIYGKLSRQILSAPVETRIFDKSAGYSQLQIQELGPRLSLRKFARRQMIMMLVMSFLFGRIFLGASSLGFMTLVTIAFFYLIIKSIFSS